VEDFTRLEIEMIQYQNLQVEFFMDCSLWELLIKRGWRG